MDMELKNGVILDYIRDYGKMGNRFQELLCGKIKINIMDNGMEI